MKIVYVALVTLLFSSVGFSQGTVKVKDASIAGERITLGQGADIVQSRLKADKFVSSGYNPGDTSKGYYNDKGVSYIVTFGPPTGGSGGYVVTQIEKVNRKETTDLSESCNAQAKDFEGKKHDAFMKACLAKAANDTEISQQKKQKGAIKKETPIDFPVIDYTAISFDTSESALTQKFPATKCEQMPNPQVRMCRLQASKSESISYLYFSGKLININGRTRTETPRPSPVTCEVAKTRFLACQQRSGDAFVDCVANINAPPGCR